jgi:serine/threonine protein kinase
MLTGVHPFDLCGTSTDEEITQQILSRTLPPIRNSPLTSHLSDDAISLIEQLLQWLPENRLRASQVLSNPWVLGETARTDKISDSDTRLSKYKAFKSKLEAKVFADMVSMATKSQRGRITDCRTTLLEHAFHNLDKDQKGYVTTKDLQKLTKGSPRVTTVESDEDEELSLSGFSGLMGETLKNRYYPAGHIIYSEGEKGDTMFVHALFSMLSFLSLLCLTSFSGIICSSLFQVLSQFWCN